MRFDQLPSPLTGVEVEIKHLGDIEIYVHAHDAVSEIPVDREDPIDLLENAINIIVDEGHPILAVDVGCNYGIQLCRMANYIKSKTENYKIVAMDPGIASELLPFNLLKNKLFSDVEFIRAAVWKEFGSVEVYREDNNSLNDNILGHPGQRLAWVSPAISLSQVFDTVPAEFSECPIIAKIDTQGADPEVLDGAAGYLERMVFISEITPWACGMRIDLPTFIEKLFETHDLYDLGDERQRFIKIVNPNTFLDKIYKSEPYWTDILGAPRKYTTLSQYYGSLHGHSNLTYT